MERLKAVFLVGILWMLALLVGLYLGGCAPHTRTVEVLVPIERECLPHNRPAPSWPVDLPNGCRPGSATYDGKDAVGCLSTEEAKRLNDYRIKVQEWITFVSAVCEEM